MLNDWMWSGNLIQQYIATQLFMFIANRFDCVPMIIDGTSNYHRNGQLFSIHSTEDAERMENCP